MSEQMKFEVFKSRNQYRWRLRVSNGRVVANSGESYRRKIDCMRGIGMVRAVNVETETVEI